MATQRPAVEDSLAAFSGRLLLEREVAPRAQIIASEASSRVGGIPVVVYLFDANAGPRWSARGSAGDVNPPAQCEALTLATLADQHTPVLFSGEDLVREHYAHLDVRRTVVSLAYVPLLRVSYPGKAGSGGPALLGAIEAISF